MSTEQQLAEIRVRIDELDQQLQQLLNERASLAQKVAQIKLQEGNAVQFYRPEREIQVLRKVQDRQNGPLPKEDMARLFREIMSSCLALEQKMHIAFLGPEGTFTQTAALKHFGHAVETVPKRTIDEIFRDVQAGNVDYGVVPVENSTEGVVNHTLDLLVSSSLKICGEVTLRIHQHCMHRSDTTLAQITKIYSHAQSLAQCRKWINSNASHAQLVEVSSNGEAARLAAEDKSTAAIAGETAAGIYGLDIAAHNIEDVPDNTTRFLILGREDIPPSGRDKTVLLISTTNRPGALYHLLQPFADNGISMSRIESRPSRNGLWDYLFFVDIDGHVSDAPIQATLATLQQQASILKVLGSFPKAVL